MPRCRYSDCPEGNPVIPDEQEDELRVTCPTCRDALGLPSVEEADLPQQDARTRALAEGFTFRWAADPDWGDEAGADVSLVDLLDAHGKILMTKGRILGEHPNHREYELEVATSYYAALET